MDFQAFLGAPPLIQLHAGAAAAALAIGAVQLLGSKGRIPHRVLGVLWTALMAVAAISAVFIREVNDGRLSPIHLFVPLTLFGLVGLVRSIRLRHWKRHRRIVLSLYFGALVVPGLFAFLPGRLMHEIFLAAPPAQCIDGHPGHCHSGVHDRGRS